MKRTLTLLAILSLLATTLVAQATTKIYELKFRTADEMVQLLGDRPDIGRISQSAAFNTLTVTGSADLHEIVSALLSRYDRPAPQYELRFYLLKAERTKGEDSPDVPQEIDALLTEVSELTRYEHFELIDSPIVRLTAGHGAAISGEAKVSYAITIGGRNSSFDRDGSNNLRVDQFQAHFKVQHFRNTEGANYRTAAINTSFTIADGERLILGTSQLAEQGTDEPFAVITIVYAKLL